MSIDTEPHQVQHRWNGSSLCTLAHKCDWIPFKPLVANGMIEEHAHDIADLGLGGIGEIVTVASSQLSKPGLDCDRSYICEVKVAPAWLDPSNKKFSIDNSCSMGMSYLIDR